MGANISTQNIESMTKQINNSLTKVIQKVNTTISSSTMSDQTISLDMRESVNCSPQIHQKSKTTFTSLSQLSSEISNDVATEMKNKLKEELAQIVKQKNEGINFGQTNVSALNTVSNTFLENNIESIIETEITNLVSNTSVSKQAIIINARGMQCNPTGPPFIIDQENLIEQISSNIANTLVKNAIKNVAENDVAKKITQTSDQTNAGLTFGGMIFLLIAAAAFTFFFGYKIMCYIIPIFIAVVAYGIYYYSQTNLKITLGVLIVCEIILICLELYFIYKAVRGTGNSNLIPIPKTIQIPAVSISTQPSTLSISTQSSMQPSS